MKEEKINILKKLLSSAHEFKVNTLYWDHHPLAPHENDLRNYAAPWIKKTIDFLRIIDAKTVVEIGSTRYAMTQKCIDYYNDCYNISPADAPDCCQDGHSTYFWTEEGYETHTVDIDKRCEEVIENQYVNHFKREIPKNLHIHIQDGVKFLEEFDKPIDFLFLDGWDVGTHHYADNHLRAYEAAKDKLSDNHIISIDDTDSTTSEGGKDKLLTPRLIEDGYIPLITGRQIVFFKIHNNDPEKDSVKVNKETVNVESTNRKYLPTFAELIDRMTICQLKAIFIPENKEAYDQEIKDIKYDIDQIIKEKNINLTSDMILGACIVMLSNRYIWENESKCRSGEDQDLSLLKLTHSINGVRNTAKNLISRETGERVDLKIDCLAAELVSDLQNWDIFK